MKPNSKIASFFNALFVDLRHSLLTKKIEGVVRRMNPAEKIIFIVASIAVVVTGIGLLIKVSNTFLLEVPSSGGSFTEGIVGAPRFINPVLAISDTDKDLSSLIYSGLLKTDKDGNMIPDIASSVEIKDNGRVYHAIIKADAKFHDGKDVTADDMIFTVEKILDPIIKSPKKSLWEGVQVEKLGEKELTFTLSKPYGPFIGALTIGILPKHIWQNISSEEFPFSQFNLSPIGAGLMKVEKVSRNGSGLPSSITLSSYKKHTLPKTLIKSIVFKFFQNENLLLDAYNEDSVDNMTASPSLTEQAKTKGAVISSSSLPRIFGVFFNQNLAPVFINKEVREALDLATPKQKIVDEVLLGHGKVLSGPAPLYTEEDPTRLQGDIIRARQILEDAGWKTNDEGILEKKTKNSTVALNFSISTSDSNELRKTAEILKEAWESVGARVDVKVFESADLSQNVIKTRKYDALLFGEAIENNSDLYPFWHSSNRNDPGLNVSLYANITVDKTLEEIQTSTDPAEIQKKTETILSEIKTDVPAIFLFSPDLLYVQKGKVKNISLKKVGGSSDRFVDLNNWYIETQKIWKFFVKN